MYISCPKCATKFVIKAEQLGENGRKVKCSKCSHIWLQMAEEQSPSEIVLTPEPIIETKLGGGVNLPALVPVRVQPYLYVTPIILIGLIIFMLATLFPHNTGFDSMLNKPYLTIQEVSIENQEEIDKIIISYKIYNSSDRTKKIPLARIRLLDKNQRPLQSKIDDHSDITMQPGQIVTVKTEFVPVPKGTDNVDIMLGNKIDFFLR